MTGLRPTQTRWFEMLTSRDRTVWALHSLAGSGLVQLEVDPRAAGSIQTTELIIGLTKFEALATEFRTVWPRLAPPQHGPERDPEVILDAALACLHTWAAEARPVAGYLMALRERQVSIKLLRELVSTIDPADLDLGLLKSQQGPLAVSLLALPRAKLPRILPDNVMSHVYHTPRRSFLLLVGERAAIGVLTAKLKDRQATALELPEWLSADRTRNLQHINQTAASIRAAMAECQRELDALAKQHRLVPALADIALVRWYVAQAPRMTYKDQFCRTTGWTTDMDGRQLEKKLAADGVRARLRFCDPPPGSVPPGAMHNPVWAQPYEFLTSLFGQPAGSEVDPSRLLAFITPLLFGYMFPDVGHGAILMLSGVLLGIRWPQARMLISCGLSAVVFGFVFGDVFGRHDIVDPLWAHAFDQPLLVLLVPMVFAVGLLLLGLLLGALQARWRGELSKWWRLEAPIVMIYLGLVLLPLDRRAAIALMAGIVWYLLGSIRFGSSAWFRKLLASAGSLMERVFQLFINTISFLRVGAFALAHAGLSTAVLALAEIPQSQVGHIVVLILGTAILLLLEGLIVTVQTMRLIFFEFFSRFLHARGRRFIPLKRTRR